MSAKREDRERRRTVNMAAGYPPKGASPARPDRPVLRDYDPELVARLWAECEPERDEEGAVIEIPVFEMPTTYTISALPLDHPDAALFEVTVEYRDAGRWAVCRPKRCLGADGLWDWEPRPSEREDKWLETHRFDLETALRLARAAAPDVKVNGVTAREVAAEIGATP